MAEPRIEMRLFESAHPTELEKSCEHGASRCTELRAESPHWQERSQKLELVEITENNPIIKKKDYSRAKGLQREGGETICWEIWQKQREAKVRKAVGCN